MKNATTAIRLVTASLLGAAAAVNLCRSIRSYARDIATDVAEDVDLSGFVHAATAKNAAK